MPRDRPHTIGRLGRGEQRHTRQSVVRTGAEPVSSRLLVTADDCTGALESAALCADAGWEVVVSPWSAPVLDAPCAVIDLRCRHVAPGDAAQRLLEIGRGDGLRVHKIDSTLRGNWTSEIDALVELGRRVLLVASYPQAHRVCRGGVVYERGVPVAETAHARDLRSPVRTSRPAEALPGAVELRDLGAVRSWLARGVHVGVADAGSDSDIDAIVAAAVPHRAVVVVGTAQVVGAVARLGRTARRPMLPELRRPMLVVCGSAHPASRAQLRALAAAGVPVGEVGQPFDVPADVEVVALASAATLGGDAAAHAQQLADDARSIARRRRVRTVVIVGGDTAEEFLGSSAVTVHGSTGVGMAVGSAVVDGRSITVVSKPGGFGSIDALVEIVGAGQAR